MININLLPWRAEQKKEQQKILIIHLSISLVLTFIGLIIVHIYLTNILSAQKVKNDLLQNEIQAIDQRLTGIKEKQTNFNQLQEQLTNLEKVYNNRVHLVNFLNYLTKILPKEIKLTKIVIFCGSVNLSGLSQSNEAITTLLNKITSTNFLINPTLGEIKAKEKENATSSEQTQAQTQKSFDLKFSLKNVGC